MTSRDLHGFTLFELLTVVAIVAGLTAAGVLGLRHAAGGQGRDAAVALLAGRLAEARQLALSRGEPARLMLHADPAQPERYLRWLVLAVPDGVNWRASDAGLTLPAGFVVLPATPLGTEGPGAVRVPAEEWLRGSGGPLRSTALRPYAGTGAEPPFLGTTGWLVVHFSATGGVFAGDLVVARGRRFDAAVPARVVCERPDDVAGLALSSYGVPTVARGRAEF